MWQKTLAALVLTTAALGAQADSGCLVSAQGIGGVRLGMSTAEVQHRWPQAEISRRRDAEGVALIRIRLSPQVVIDAFANEEDPEDPINRAAKFTWLSTMSPACRTAGGVQPGMRLRQAAQKLGTLKKMTLTEIEMREFAEFARQPQWLVLLVAGGIYDGQTVPQTTRRYENDARIVALEVGR